MGNMSLIPENLMAMSHALATGSTSASGSMQASNMLTEAPSKFWRSSSNWPTKCGTTFSHYGYSAFGVNSIAIFGHNLARGDQYRIWLYETDGSGDVRPTGATIDNPTGTVAGLTTNTTSTYADVDNGETLTPSTSAVPTDGTLPWSIGLSFPTPAGIINGTDLQAFWVSASTVLPWPASLPTITVDLYEGGVFRQSLGTRRVRDAGNGQVMCFPFDAANLSVSSGANIECKISCVPRTGGQYVAINSVVLATDRDARQGDSGWLTYNPFVGSGVTYRPEWDKSNGAIRYKFPLTYNPFIVYVNFRSSRSPTDFVPEEEIHPLTHNYVQVGTVVIGEQWSPTHNIGYGKLVGGIDSSPRSRTYGGQLFGSRRPVRRVIGMRLGHLTPAEAHTLFDRVIWRHGTMKPIAISLLPDDATQSKHTTILATLRNPENWIDIQPEEGVENAMTMEWEEVL